jgi:hypothetical protein
MAGLSQRRPQPLTGHLQQPEPGQPPDLDARAIHLHGVAQPVFDLALILRGLHIDEVDDDQASDIPNAQLACNLVRRFEVRIQRRGFDITAASCAS